MSSTHAHKSQGVGTNDSQNGKAVVAAANESEKEPDTDEEKSNI